MRPDVSSGTRGLVLGRIRDGLGTRSDAAAREYGEISREYQQSPTLDADARTALFAERLRHYDVGVHRCEQSALPQTISSVLARRGKSALLVPRGLPRDWLPETLNVVRDAPLSAAELDRCEGVLTGCSVAIASTGTIVMRHADAEGRRAATLVPDYHLCVVFAGQIAQTVPEAFRVLAESKPALVTTISGPSATADIEMTRIRGVHGPRTLDVVIVVG